MSSTPTYEYLSRPNSLHGETTVDSAAAHARAHAYMHVSAPTNSKNGAHWRSSWDSNEYDTRNSNERNAHTLHLQGLQENTPLPPDFWAIPPTPSTVTLISPTQSHQQQQLPPSPARDNPTQPHSISISHNIRTLVVVAVVAFLVACAAVAIAVVVLTKGSNTNGSDSGSDPANASGSTSPSLGEAARIDVREINGTAANIDATLVALTAAISHYATQNAMLMGMIQALNQTQQQLISASFQPFRFDPLLCTGSSTGWVRDTMPVGALCRRTNTSANGCGSIFLDPGRPYSSVSAWVTLYQFGTPDAFSIDSGTNGAYLFAGDSLTIWAGPALVWDYAVGYSQDQSSSESIVYNCPADGGSSPPSALGSNWACATGASGLPSVHTFYSTPLFGPTKRFTRTITPTSSPLELRICLNQEHNNEDIYVGDFSLTVS